MQRKVDVDRADLDPEKLMTVGEVAAWVGITPQALWLWRRDRKLGDGLKVGKVTLYKFKDIMNLPRRAR